MNENRSRSDLTPTFVNGQVIIFNKTIAFIYWVVFISFMANKFMIRPFVLKHEFNLWIQTFVLSYPNFCEAIIGGVGLVGIMFTINARYVQPKWQLNEYMIYAGAHMFAAIFVITQEFKIHNLGGRNVYDPYDVLFSIFGLITSYLLFIYIRPLHARMSTLSLKIQH